MVQVQTGMVGLLLAVISGTPTPALSKEPSVLLFKP
jgi:hypothetical protein